MQNVSCELKGSKLVLTIDVSAEAIKKAPLSTSGKNKLIASSGGNQNVDGKDGIKFGLNVYTKA